MLKVVDKHPFRMSCCLLAKSSKLIDQYIKLLNDTDDVQQTFVRSKFWFASKIVAVWASKTASSA